MIVFQWISYLCARLKEAGSMDLTCSEGGKASAVNGEAVHRLTTAATAAASCGGAQDQTASPVACRVLHRTQPYKLSQQTSLRHDKQVCDMTNAECAIAQGERGGGGKKTLQHHAIPHHGDFGFCVIFVVRCTNHV